MTDPKNALMKTFYARQAAGKKRKPPGRVSEDDPRWMQMPAHGPGQERKVGANVTRPYGYLAKRAHDKEQAYRRATSPRRYT